MTVSLTTRLNLTVWDDDDDEWTREQIEGNFLALEARTIIGDQGTQAARPAAGVQRRLYLATDTERLYLDDGDEWHELLTTGNVPVPAATAVPFTPTGGIAATTVAAALAELDTEKAPKAAPVFTGAPTTAPAEATDPAQTMALVNYLRSRLITTGLIAATP